MSSTTDVIVIGGGIAGAGCALHLAEAGREVRLIERDAPAGKASGRAAGHLTVFQGGEFTPAIGAYCREFYEELTAERDRVTLRRLPAYQIAHTDEGADRLARRREDIDLPSELLSREEFAAREPGLNPEGVTAALAFERGVHTDPYAATMAIHDAAREAGATLRDGERVVDLRETADGVAVETDAGRYEAPVVVAAAGVWTPGLADMLGLTVPLVPRTSQIAILDPPEPIEVPIFSCPDIGVYGRGEPNGEVLIGGGAWTVVDDPDDFSTDAREDYREEVAEVAPRIAGALADARLANHWAGRCSATPARHPLVGDTEVPGFYLCAGFNGEGISYAPFAGRLLADLVVGRDPTFDPAPFDPRGVDAEGFEIRNAIDW